MYVHIGKDVVINSDNIISILDIESLEKNKKLENVLQNLKNSEVYLMKNKITLTIILTSLFMLLTGALTAHAACTGHLDGVSGDTISGWAWDPEDPQKEVSVTLTIKNAADSAVVRSLTVNACRSDRG